MEQESSHREINGNEIIVEFLASAYVIFVVVFFWEKPAWAFLALTAGIALQLFFWKSRLEAAVMVVAALLGAPSEVLCIQSGLWSYHAPGLVFGIPIWLPLVWAYLICLFHRISLTVYDSLLRFFSGPESVGLTVLFFVLGFLITTYYLVSILLIARTFAITFTLFMIVVAVFRHSRKDILLFVVGALLGTTGEFICMKLGFWQYHNPRLRSLGLPLSLPLAWGLSSIIIVSLAELWYRFTKQRKPASGAG